LRQWKKPGVYLRAEDIRGISMNQRRQLSGLPPLNTQELAKLDELNQETANNMREIGAYLVAIISIIPQLFKNHADLFPPSVAYHIFRVHADLITSLTNVSSNKIDWGRWFKIATAYEKYESYRAASRKTGFQAWGDEKDKLHRVSPKYIKQKFPEVIKFQEEVKNANFNFGVFLLNLRHVLRNEPELRELYNAAYEKVLQTPHKEKRSDVHQYYIIRHKLEKGRKECGPFKEGQIPGLTKRVLLA
jgi:hypothetical protein